MSLLLSGVIGLTAGALFWMWHRAVHMEERDHAVARISLGRAASLQRNPFHTYAAAGAASAIAATVLFKTGFAALVAAALAVLLLWLSGRETAERRKEQMARAFPDFLELLAMALSSGLNLEAGWFQAASHVEERGLRTLLQDSLRGFQIGESRATVLSEFARRLNDPRLTPIAALLNQALKRGSPLEQILLQYAESLRNLAFLEIEKRAQTLGIRLLFPLIVFIFPTFFIVLLGPLILQIIQTGRLF